MYLKISCKWNVNNVKMAILRSHRKQRVYLTHCNLFCRYSEYEFKYFWWRFSSIIFIPKIILNSVSPHSFDMLRWFYIDFCQRQQQKKSTYVIAILTWVLLCRYVILIVLFNMLESIWFLSETCLLKSHSVMRI